MKKLLTGALALAFTMTSSAFALAEKVEISYWHIPMGKISVLKDVDLVKNFMTENPNIKVAVEEVPCPYMEEKTLLAIMSEELPNVERDYLGRLAAWAHKGVLECLDGTLSSKDLEDFVPGVLDAFRIENKLMGYPLEFWLQSYAVNKTILDRAGAITPNGSWTVSEWMKIAEKVKALGDPDLWSTMYACKSTAGDYWTLMNFQMWGAKLWTDGDYTKTTLNSPEGIKALEQMLWMTENGYAPRGAPGRTGAEYRTLLVTGKIAMAGSDTRQGTLKYRQELVKSGQVSELQDLRLVPTPHVENMPTAGLYFGPTGVVVFEEEDLAKSEAAIELAQFLANPASCEAIAIGDCQNAARRSINPWADEPAFQKMLEMMNEYGTADLGLSSPFYLESRHLFYPELQYAFMELKTPEEALNDFAKKVEELWK